jgi:hypothetical protein
MQRKLKGNYRTPEGVVLLEKAMDGLRNWDYIEADKHPKYGWDLIYKKGNRGERHVTLYLGWDGKVSDSYTGKVLLRDITAPGAVSKLDSYVPSLHPLWHKGNAVNFKQAVLKLAKSSPEFRRALKAELTKQTKRASVVQETMDAYADANYPLPEDMDPMSDEGYLQATSKRKLIFRSRQWLKPREWAALMEKATPGGYNYFEPKKVLRWLNTMESKLNLKGSLEVQPARENSVMMYVRGPQPLIEALVKGGRRGVVAIDEVGWETSGPQSYVAWFWWD